MGNQIDATALLGEIHGAVADTLAGYGLTNYRVGEVTKVEPLEIKISDRVFLKEHRLLLTEAVLEKKLDLTHLHQVTGETGEASGPSLHKHGIDVESKKALTTAITINEGLKEGDFVHLLSVMKNQKFVVLGKIREKQKVMIDASNNWKWS